jgi:hypothetical protein
VTKIKPDGSDLVWSTYLGGSGNDSLVGDWYGVGNQTIAVDQRGDVYVAGFTRSLDFPTVNPLQPSNHGGQDALVAKLSADGSSLLFSTYLGGSGDENLLGMTVDLAGNIYVAGWTSSSDFPTVNPLQPSNRGGADAFVAILHLDTPDNLPPSLAPVANKTFLWPPNHKMVEISIAANATDDSRGPVTLTASISSNEPEDGFGDGDTAPDWTEPVIDQASGVINFQLRAERSGSGNGRVYTITIIATEDSGNSSQSDVEIVVLHDQKGAILGGSSLVATGELWTASSNPTSLPEVLHLSVVDGVLIDAMGHGVTLGGDVHVSTEPGVPSIALDGYGDFVKISNSPDWNLGTQDFIIECNFYMKSFENQAEGNVNLVNSNSWTEGWQVGVNGLYNPEGAALYFYDYITDFGVGSPPLTWNLNEWYNVKVVRNGMTVTLYRNDIAVGSGVTTAGFAGNGTLVITRIDGLGALNGYISSLIIAKGQPGINNQVPYPAPTGGGSYLHGAAVTLGGKVFDFDGDLVDYEWRENGTLLFSGEVQTIPQAVPVHLPLHVLPTPSVGEHTLALCITDGFHPPTCSDISVTILDQEEGPCVEPPANLVSWWPGDINALDIWDGNHGTLMNGATFDQGFVDQAFSLDGTDDYVDLGTGDNLNFPTSDFTVEFWVNFRGKGSEEVMLEKYVETFGAPGPPREGWSFTKLYSSPRFGSTIRLQLADTPDNWNALDVRVSTPPKTWIHAAVTRSGDTFTIYWNGVAIGSATFPGVNLDTLASLKLGHRGNPNDPAPSVSTGSLDTRDFYLNGLIDEVEIYNRALTVSEIQTIYLAREAGKCKQANNPPIANAGPTIAIASNAQNTSIIQGTASDSDNDSLTYRWIEGGNVLLGWRPVDVNGEARLYLSTVPGFTVGQHTLTLEVNDGHVTFSDDMILTIDNSAPHPAPTGGGIYQLNTPLTLGGQISDFDGDLVSYEWKEGGTVLVSGQIQTLIGGTPVDLPVCMATNLALGIHTITLWASDGVNAPVSVDITVEIIDSAAPGLAPVPDESILWPPNHQMVPINIVANASDNSGDMVTLSAAVSSNEPQNGLGDGDTAPDWTTPVIDQVNGIITLELRAERSGSGNGRIYTITITATDTSGNSSQANIQIIVPHDKSKK